MNGLARRLGLAGFWRWWSSELAPLVPAGTRTAMRRRRTRPVLAFDADSVALWEPEIRDGVLAMVERASFSLAGDAGTAAAAGRAALAGLRRNGAAAGGPRVVVALPARQVLRRTIVLPAALEENLQQALAYDLDRHTPFKAEELYFDAAVVGRDATRDEIRVDLAAARRSVVDPAVRQAESFGANVVAVAPDPPQAVTVSGLNLLRASSTASDVPWRWGFWLPLTLLGLVAVAAIALPLWQKRTYAIALTRATDDARTKAAVSETLRRELEKQTSEYNFVLERKYAFPSSLDVLNEVTKLLPDDTWLLQMEVKSVPRAKEPQRELLLRGESANAGRLISAFEESRVFTQAAPRSPTTKIQPGPGEIFDLAAQVRPVPLPAGGPAAAEPLAKVESPAPAPAPTPATPAPAAAQPAAPGARAPAPVAPAPNASATAAKPPAVAAPPSVAPPPPPTPTAAPSAPVAPDVPRAGPPLPATPPQPSSAPPQDPARPRLPKGTLVPDGVVPGEDDE